MGQNWYQSTAYDYLLPRWTFIFIFKGPCPFKFKKMFTSTVEFVYLISKTIATQTFPLVEKNKAALKH
jgi:hypothetical protein